MALAMLLPSVFPKWFTPAGDAVLAGGSLSFFAVGTTTPKSVYADYQQLAALGSVVTLDGAGDATIFLGSGGYKVILKDALGAQLDVVDGIFGTGGSASVDSTATYGFFKVYNDVRALTVTPDFAYVAGRDVEGDGGEGIFQLQPSVVAHDDDGIFLAAAGGSTEYKRIFDAAINPEWYGVKYATSLDQSVRLGNALTASAAVNFPVAITGRVFLGQNVLVPVGASVVTNLDGYFQSGTAVTLTFQAGTRFDGRGIAFASAVQPIFAANTVDAIRLSWMGGTGSEMWTKLLASTAAKIPVLMDVSTSLTSGLTIPANLALEPVGGAVVTFNGAAWLEVGSLNFRSPIQWAAFASEAFVGNIAIGSDVCYMEWFGGSPANTGSANAIPFKCCMKAQRIDLVAGSVTYTVTSAIPLSYANPGTVQFVGNSSTININQTVTLTTVETNQITIGGSGVLNVTSGTYRSSIILIKLMGDFNKAQNSTLADVNRLAKSNDSRIFAGLVEIRAALDNCDVTLVGTTHIEDGLVFNGCTFRKAEFQKLPAFTAPVEPTKMVFSGCHFYIDGALLYSENTSLTVDLVSCTDSDGWTKGIHNGYAAVNLIGCNCRGNSTATTVDGVSQRLFDEDPVFRKKGIIVAADPIIITNGITYWHGAGIGTMTVSGDAIVIGETLTLDSTPWGLNTIRYAPVSPSGEGWPSPLFAYVWRMGGQLTAKIEYPAGVAPDPAVRLCVAAVCPAIPVGLGITGHHFYGKSTSIGMLAVAAAKAKNFVNIWGGQSNINTPSIGGPYDCVDEWGDVSFSRAANTPVWGLFRIVIYNEGSGSIPVGTKITLELGSYAPTTEQYRKYWPDTPFTTVAGTGTQSGGGGGIGGPGLWKTPYVFRSSDANGLEIAKARPDFGTGILSPTPIDLPVTVWTNGTTLAGSYS